MTPTDVLDSHESALRIGSQLFLRLGYFCIRPKTLSHKTSPLTAPVVRNLLRVKFVASFNADHAGHAKFYLEPGISKPVFSSIGLFYGGSFARHCRELKRIKGAAGKTAVHRAATDPCLVLPPEAASNRSRKFAFRHSSCGACMTRTFRLGGNPIAGPCFPRHRVCARAARRCEPPIQNLGIAIKIDAVCRAWH
jgi:hypothetical protein